MGNFCHFLFGSNDFVIFPYYDFDSVWKSNACLTNCTGVDCTTCSLTWKSLRSKHQENSNRLNLRRVRLKLSDNHFRR